MNCFCISITFFYKSKFIRAEKNSELNKTSKMKVLEKIVKIFKNTVFPITFLFDVWLGLNVTLKSICSGNTKKSSLGQFFLQSYRHKALIFMKQDFTGEKIVSTLKYGHLFDADLKILIFRTSWYKNKIGF